MSSSAGDSSTPPLQALIEGLVSTPDGVPAAVSFATVDPVLQPSARPPEAADQLRRPLQIRGRSGCCHAHGDPSGDALRAETYPGLPIRTVIISGVSVALDSIAFTQGLGRFAEKEMTRLEEEAKSDLPTKPKKPRDQGTIHLSPSYICRNHCSGSSCRFASNCRFAHVCPVQHPNLVASDPSTVGADQQPRLVAYPSHPLVSTFPGQMMSPPPSYSPFVVSQPGLQFVPAPLLYAPGLVQHGGPSAMQPQPGGIFINPPFGPGQQPMLVGDPPRALTLVPAMPTAAPQGAPPSGAVYSFSPSGSSPPQFIFGGFPIHR